MQERRSDKGEQLRTLHPHDHTGRRHSDSHLIVCPVAPMRTMHEVDVILTDATFATCYMHVEQETCGWTARL